MSKGFVLAIVSGILSAFSQVLLKKSAATERTSVIREYLNIWVISGYVLTVICMILMILAYKEIPFKYGAALESLVYVYTMFLGKIFFGESITWKKISGNALIVVGVILFSLG